MPKAWDLQARKSYSGWKFSLVPWAIRSHDSGIFRHAFEGSTTDLLRVLSSHEASIYDRSPEGWTLLHVGDQVPSCTHGSDYPQYAASKGQLEMFQKLLELGLSVHEADALGITPLYHLCREEDDVRKALDIYRYLSSLGALDEVIQDVFSPTYRKSRQTSLYRLVWKNDELLDFVITQFHPTFYQLPAEYRFKSINWIYTDPKVLLHILTTNDVVTPTLFLAQLHENCQSSLHEFSRLYFKNCLDSLGSDGTLTKGTKFNHWRELVRWMFVGSSIGDICRIGHEIWEYVSPLFAGLLACNPVLVEKPLQPRLVRRRLLATIRLWLEDLSQAGVDLKGYGEQESTLHGEDDWLQRWRWNNLTDVHDDCAIDVDGPLLTSFIYGPVPGDWALQWDTAVEDFVGQFWQVFEVQPTGLPRMPGQWVED